MILEVKSYENPPEGLHKAVCIDVVDRGIMESQFGARHVIELRWALETKNSGGINFITSKSYSATLNPKGNLAKDLSIWLNKKFAEGDKLDFESLVGTGAQLYIKHNIKADGRVFANVQTLMPYPKEYEAISVPATYVRVQDRPKDSDAVPF